MNTNLKIALRNLYRDKVYAAINIAGLALATCCCLIVALYLRHELSYDLHHVNHKKIFRVVNELTTNGAADSTAETSLSLAPMLKESYAVVEDYVQLQPVATKDSKKLLRYGDKTYYWSNWYSASDNIFKVFTHKIIYGDPNTALLDTNAMAVSETFARQYFGDANPIGKVIESYTGVSKHITLVFADLPDNSHLKYDVLTSMNHDRFKIPNDVKSRREGLFFVNFFTYLVLPENFNPAEYDAMSADFYQKNMAEKGKPTWRSWLQPLADIHLQHSNLRDDLPTGNRFYLYGFAAVGIFILLVACINYINLATARATRNGKSVGMRKIIGASRASLMMQFLSEAIFFALIAAVIGIVLAEIVLTLSPLNSLIGKQLSLNLSQEPALLLAALGASLAVGIISGLYPALYLSSWAPLSALAASHRSSRNSIRFRQLLVFLQFTISIAVITCTLLMFAQMRFIAGKPLGFAKENRVMITLRGADLIEKVPTITRELSNDRHVLGITTSESMMGRDIMKYGLEMENNEGGFSEISSSNMKVGDNFIEVMGLQLLSGRSFVNRLPTDAEENVVVNEALVQQMGWTQPIGKRVKVGNILGNVIGVVADFNFKSLHNSVEPMQLYTSVDNFSRWSEIGKRIAERIMIVNIAGDDIGETLKLLERKFTEVDPTHPFEFKFVDDSLNELYHSEQNMMKLIGIFAVICIFISCMGLFGLAVFATEQRTKEIGIRKVLGASVSQIITLLARNILLLVVAGAVVASILAYLIIDQWLVGFAYRGPINPMTFVISTLLAVLVAYLTIATQSYRTAKANPIKALRYE